MSATYRYYVVMIGLRGCYMPDTVHHIRVTTRRELHDFVKGEAGFSNVGLSKRNVAWLAAHAWRQNDALLPFGYKGQRAKYQAIEVSRSTRKDWLEATSHDDENLVGKTVKREAPRPRNQPGELK